MSTTSTEALVSRPVQGTSAPSEPVWHSSPRVWFGLSVAAAVLAGVGNIIGLAAVERVYGTAYPSLTNQAIAQDLVNLFVVAPALIVLAIGALRGSLPAYLAWLGVLVFTVYNYVIYAFAIRFGPLFLVWVGVLGVAVFALLGGVGAVDTSAVRARFGQRRMWLPAWFMIAMAVLFGGLWLADIVPALVSGDVPGSTLDMGVPTNPVHVLDLAFFLPATLLIGVLLLRRRAFAYTVGPAILAFLALTGVPILVTPFVAGARGESANWTATAPIVVITVASLLLLARMLTAARARRS
jgi:hypothetical protein